MQSKADTMTLPVQTNVAKPLSVNWRDFVVYIFFAIVLAFFAVTIGDKGFLSVANLFNITRTTSMIAIMAIAMTFVIAAGELDLSIGSSAALSALVAALVMKAGYGIAAGVAAGILSGLAVGALNSFFVTVINIPSFLVTLGSMQLIRGLDMRLTYTKPVAIAEPTFNNLFGSGSIGPVPSLFIWSLVAVVVGHVALALHHIRPSGSGHRRQPRGRPLFRRADAAHQDVLLPAQWCGWCAGGPALFWHDADRPIHLRQWR